MYACTAADALHDKKPFRLSSTLQQQHNEEGKIPDFSFRQGLHREEDADPIDAAPVTIFSFEEKEEKTVPRIK